MPFELLVLAGDGEPSAEVEELDARVSVANARVACRAATTRDDRAHESAIDDIEQAPARERKRR